MGSVVAEADCGNLSIWKNGSLDKVRMEVFSLYILLSILLTIVGIVMIFNPQLVYEITQSWKNSGNSEPSEMYIWHTRLGGGVFVIVGVVCTGILVFLL